MNMGRLEIKIWKDTGEPKFRFWWSTEESVPYRWMFKVLSYWTLWVAWRMKSSDLPEWYHRPEGTPPSPVPKKKPLGQNPTGEYSGAHGG